jgi:glycosyltransferase involved in cell wall biosynthesis
LLKASIAIWTRIAQGAAMTAERPSLLILGTRGIPASHGGFETFAEHLALYLVERGWDVGVYCQEEVAQVDRRIRSERWRGVELITVQVSSTGPRATLEFDAICTHHAASRQAVSLVLGYNSGLFLPYLRLRGRKIITNMDGIEWRRPKWSRPVRAWFWVNEWIAAWASNLLIADHPAIADHLATRRSRQAIAMIPYGGVPVEAAADAPVRALGLEPGRYLVSIARIEPDNSILPLVKAFSQRKRGAKLVVLGSFDPDNAYHASVLAAGGEEVVFPGAIYDGATVQALRYHARAYVHGHTVGGTNPSLVEALWAGNAVIAHDNVYNRWTAGEAGVFFSDEAGCAELMEQLLRDDALVARLSASARARAVAEFSWGPILARYEAAARRFLTASPGLASSSEQRV